MIRTPTVISKVIEKINADDFKDLRHRAFFKGIVEGWQADRVTDEISAGNYLLETGVLKDGDDYSRLADLVPGAPAPELMMRHIDQVADNGVRWRIEAGTRRLRQAYEDGDPVARLMELADELTDTAVKPQTGATKRLGETLDDLLDDIDAMQSGEHEDTSIKSGIPDLDDITGGFKPGQLIIVAARPGVGKSTLALDVMREASIRNKIPTLMFSLEMSEREVQERALSAEAKVSITGIRRGELTERDWDQVILAKETLQAVPIYVDDSLDLTMLDITAKSKQQTANNGVGLIVVDYLQLLKSGGQAESRQQEVSDFSRQLKLLAKSCGVPVIAVAQLNREIEKRGDDALPKASDLRESGSLEQDADQIIMIHRPDAQNKDHEKAGEADLLVVKNRGGDTGTATVANMLRFSKFVPLA